MIPYGLRPDSCGVLVIKGSQYMTTASPLMPRIWGILDFRSFKGKAFGSAEDNILTTALYIWAYCTGSGNSLAFLIIETDSSYTAIFFKNRYKLTRRA